MIEGLIQEKHTSQSDSTVHLMEAFSRLLSLPFLPALQAGGLAYRYECTQKTVIHFLAMLVWSGITNTVISSECTDLRDANQSHVPQGHCFFGWKGKTGKKASMTFLHRRKAVLQKT